MYLFLLNFILKRDSTDFQSDVIEHKKYLSHLKIVFSFGKYSHFDIFWRKGGNVIGNCFRHIFSKRSWFKASYLDVYII